MPTADGRMRHYGTFYGLDVLPGDSPILLVHGNCQAESLRVLVAGSAASTVSSGTSAGFRAVRIPPVFELTAADLPHLTRLTARASVLISQPVADDYRDLPVGTSQLAGLMPAGGTVIRCPIVRYTGFHPWQAIIRDPRDRSRNPPVVPYHDLRTLAAARHGTAAVPDEYGAEALRQVGKMSQAELSRRERRDCDVTISDVFDHPQPGDMLTINHPGNRVLVELARRIQRALGLPTDAADPGRVLLGEVVAPVEDAALEALNLADSATVDWLVNGRTVEDATVREAQLRWYGENPAVVAAGYARHGAVLDVLGLG